MVAGAVWIFARAEVPVGVGFLEAIGLMTVDLETWVLEEIPELTGAGVVFAGILIVPFPGVIIVLCLVLEEVLGKGVADLGVTLGVTILLRELVGGVVIEEEGLELLRVDLFALMEVMIVVLF